MLRNLSRHILLAVVVVVASYVLGRVTQRWKPDFIALSEERSKYAQAGKGPVEIAVAWRINDYNGSFLDGAELAAEVIKQRGGILGRPVKLRFFGSRSSVAARDIAQSTHIPVVIGHETSGEAIPASITYQKAGLLFIAPTATHPDLTAHDFNMVFRSVPDDRDMIHALAREGGLQGVNRMAVLCVRSAYGNSLRMRMEQYAGDNGIMVVGALSYSPLRADFREISYNLRGKSVDAVFVGDSTPRAAYLIKQLREQNIQIPVLGCDGLDDYAGIAKIVGNKATNTYVVSVYHPPETGVVARTEISRYEKTFLDAYLKKTKTSPDVYAAVAYDAIMLYAQVVEKANTTDPVVVASMLKYGGSWNSLRGLCSFDEYGNLVEKKLVIKEWSKDGFRAVKSKGEVK